MKPDWAQRRTTMLAGADRLRERVQAGLRDEPVATVASAADLDLLTEACIRALTRAGADVAALAILVVDLQRLALQLREHDLVSGTVRLAQAERGLARLRACTSTSVLLDQVCPEVTRSCGFARVLLSRVEAGHWHPWEVNEAVAGESWVAQWNTNSIPLDDSIREGRLLLEHRAALIDDVDAPDIHPIIRAGRSHSYVVAPIVPAGRVLGFLHADHQEDGRACDETDRDVLWRFAEGFGHLYERTALLEQMRGQRRRVRDLLATVDAAMLELTEAGIELSTLGSPGSASPAVGPVRESDRGPADLTPREKEVLELIVAGAANGEIAERLSIGAGTVKTHVKHILAKLGAVNRSQVIARYLGARDPGRG